MAHKDCRGYLLSAVILIICLGQFSVLKADSYASITVPDGINLNLGNVSNYGTQTFNSTLKIHVIANCAHHILASVSQFSSSTGGLIPVDRTHVDMPVMYSPTPTPPDGWDVNLNLTFTINVETSDKAGQYTGSLILTIVADP